MTDSPAFYEERLRLRDEQLRRFMLLSHYTRRMLQALDIYWLCAEGLPRGCNPRGKYTAEDWWGRYEKYRALVEEQL